VFAAVHQGGVAGRRNQRGETRAAGMTTTGIFSEYLRLRGYDTVKGTEIDKLEKVCGGADKCDKYKSFA